MSPEIITGGLRLDDLRRNYALVWRISSGVAGGGLLSDFRASEFKREISSRVAQYLPRVEPMNRFKE